MKKGIIKRILMVVFVSVYFLPAAYISILTFLCIPSVYLLFWIVNGDNDYLDKAMVKTFLVMDFIMNVPKKLFN